jgi:tetratricopeptide (TPR) repeat protein
MAVIKEALPETLAQSPRRSDLCLRGLTKALKVRRTVVAIVVVLVGLVGRAEPVRAQASQLQQAIDSYVAAMEKTDRNQRLEEFARSEQLFRQVIAGSEGQPSIENADLYVNLGNAAIQAERLGPAIAAYRRALSLSPHHAPAMQNLAFARSLVPDWARHEAGWGLVDSLLFWRTLLSREQTYLVSAVSFFAAAVLFSMGWAKRWTWPRTAAILPLLVWLVLVLSLWLTVDENAVWNAVVVSDTTVFTADSENSAPRLPKLMPSGAELKVVQQRDRWTEVLLPDGRTGGWVLTTALDRL